MADIRILLTAPGRPSASRVDPHLLQLSIGASSRLAEKAALVAPFSMI
jgi:hypothetical protein